MEPAAAKLIGAGIAAIGMGGAGGANTLAQDFIRVAMAQTGDRYVFGAEARIAAAIRWISSWPRAMGSWVATVS